MRGEQVEAAMFGAGCFWGVEARFRRLPGVLDVMSGYAGGHTAEPTYQQVCTGRTGHAEVVRVEYDPKAISYQQLLEVFWGMHDPTQVNRQGPDVGSQYRSVIFALDEHQRVEAERSRLALNVSGTLRAGIATVIEGPATFWPAEEQHQNYVAKRGPHVC